MNNLEQYLEPESSLEELFKPLGNEVRIEILLVLSRASEPLPFTTLQEEIGIEDSGNFNYHINQLTGHFIGSTDRGYELRYPGRAVIQTIREGAISSNPDIPPRQIDLACPFCGADQVFRYADETLELRCSNCSGTVDEPYEPGTLMSYEFPAAGLRGRTEREVAEAAHRLYDAEVTAMIGGVCPRCSATVESEIELCESHRPGQDDICENCHTRYLSWAVYTCSNCDHARQFPPWFKVFYLPEVIAFFHEAAGFDRELPFPKLLTDSGTDIRDVSEELRSTDPVELATTISFNDAYCTVIIDENLEVTVGEKTVR